MAIRKSLGLDGHTWSHVDVYLPNHVYFWRKLLQLQRVERDSYGRLMLRNTGYVMASVLGWPPQVPLVPPDEETGPPVESTADPQPQPEEPEISSASSISAGSTCGPTLVSVSQVPPVQAPKPGNPADAATVEDEETRPPVEIADLQPEEPEPEHQYGSSSSPYQQLAPSLEEFKELQAEVSAKPALAPT